MVNQVDSHFAISVVIPTRNEAGNIEPLLVRIARATMGMPIEVIFVDDSTDNTAAVIRSLQDSFPLPIELIVRPPERRTNGLGGAVVEGLRVARAAWVCVMDADLQHPPELIPKIFRHAEATGADIVVGSRLAPGGDASSLGLKRSLISRLFAMMTRAAFPMRLWKVTDPLSGFFIVRREAVDHSILRPNGFKILLEIMVRSPELQVSEIPIRFGYRHAGESKASVRETIRFAKLLMQLRFSADQNFIRFLVVGVSGLVVNSLFLAVFTELAGFHYLWSATAATQASTLWNFFLTEAWVFGARRIHNRSFFLRMGSFLLMNNLLLLLRAPILAFLISYLGLHYLLSNLVSLFAMTVIRFLVSDQWIWSKERPLRSNQTQTASRRFAQMINSNQSVRAPSKPGSNEPGTVKREHFVYSYNIHDIIRVASMFKLPELEYFRVPTLSEEPDIRLRMERRRRERRRHDQGHSLDPSVSQRRIRNPRRVGKDIHYSEGPGRYGFEVSIAYKDCVEVAVSPILKFSPHVLYTNVIEPILRWLFVRKGYALVHAACVAVDGWAVLVTARTDTGKTSTILRAVDNYDCSFLSDDMTIVSHTGVVMSYPKPLTISNHTLSAVNGGAKLSILQRLALQLQSRLHSRSGRGIGMKISKTGLPAATLNAIVQMLIPPPKYMIHKLIPKVSYADKAKLARAVIIERGPEFEEVLVHKQAAEVFVRNAEDAYGFPPYPVLAGSLSRWQEEDLHPQEEAIITQALKRIPTIRLRDPKFNWWQRLPLLSNSHGTMDLASADD